MSTPTLPRIDLAELGFEDWDPKIPCEMHSVRVGLLRTPRCSEQATLLVVGHKRHWTTTSCLRCWKLYLYLCDAMNQDTLCCAVCKTRDDTPLHWTEPL